MIQDKELTSTQIKGFWERLKYIGQLESIQPVYGQEEGKLVYVSPPIDLNNLFKCAKVVVQEKLGYKEFYKLLLRWCVDIADGKDPTLSLYWLFWEVIKEATDETVS